MRQRYEQIQGAWTVGNRAPTPYHLFVRPRLFIIATAAVAATITVVIVASPGLYLVYRRPDIGLAINTVAVLAGSIAAYLVLQRFARTRRVADLTLAAALGIFGSTNLLFGVIPQLAGGEMASRWGTGAIIVGRFVGGVLLLVAAMVPLERRLRKAVPVVTVVSAAVAAVLGLAALGLLIATYFPAEVDPTLVDPDLVPEGSATPALSFDPRILILHVPSVVFHAAAAAAFIRRVETTGDEFLKWVAAGAALRAAASLNYFLFPALQERYAYTGDGFRLAFYVFLLIGAAKEMRANWRDQEMEALKTQFLSNVSHELRTPLVPLLSYVPLLQYEDLDSKEIRSIAAEMEQAGGQLQRVVSLLVDYSALQAGRIHVRQEVVDITGLIESLVSEFEADPEVTITADIGADVGEVFGNHKLLHRSVAELLDNARKFSPEGADVQLDVRRRRDVVEIAVSDRGIGIEPDNIERVDRHFEQADGSITRVYGGLGLGLTFTRRIVEEMGGTMSLESEPGSGTTVTLAFPAGSADAGGWASR